jgi:hypothetical protein
MAYIIGHDLSEHSPELLLLPQHVFIASVGKPPRNLIVLGIDEIYHAEKFDMNGTVLLILEREDLHLHVIRGCDEARYRVWIN